MSVAHNGRFNCTRQRNTCFFSSRQGCPEFAALGLYLRHPLDTGCIGRLSCGVHRFVRFCLFSSVGRVVGQWPTACRQHPTSEHTPTAVRWLGCSGVALLVGAR